MHRLFVALRPPAAVRRQLLAIMQGVDGARWQDDDQLHLTLRFIGEVDRHQAEDIVAALSRVSAPPPTLAVEGVGCFDTRGVVDTIWAGMRPHDAVKALHLKVDRAVQSAGIEADRRAYLPHITLARLRRPEAAVQRYLEANAALAGDPFTLDWFGLFESHLGQQGASYELVERYRLG